MAVLDFNGLSHFKDKIYNLISSALSKKVDKVNGKGLSQNDLTNELKQKYDSAYAHSTSNHAPSNAQENEIEEIKLNGNVITPNSKSVDITGVSLINHNHDDRYYTKSEINALTNTDTHYTTHLKVGASATATANAAATNGNVYINALDNTTVRDSHKIVGSGATTVTSDENGVITINSTNTNTTYSSGRGITLSGTQFKLNDNCTIITDWDDAVTTGWYMASNASNAPVTSGGWFYGEVIAHNTKYVRQILYHFATNSDVTGTNCNRYERVKHNDTWGLWVDTSVRTAVPANAKFINNIYCQTTEPSVSDTVVWLPYS